MGFSELYVIRLVLSIWDKAVCKHNELNTDKASFSELTEAIIAVNEESLRQEADQLWIMNSEVRGIVLTVLETRETQLERELELIKKAIEAAHHF